MRKSLAAIVSAAAMALFSQQVSATVFPSLTTIYIGTGVVNFNFVVTTFHCTNVSGVPASVRFLLLSPAGSSVASHTATVAHGATYVVSTQDSPVYVETFTFTNPTLQEGAVNIEATNSGVFCTAVTSSVGSITSGPSYAIPLVRVNAHPGTVE